MDDRGPSQSLLTSLGILREQVEAQENSPDAEHPQEVVGRRGPVARATESFGEEPGSQQGCESVGEPNETKGDPRRVPHDPTRRQGAKAFETPSKAGVSDG